jgi:hypothetical protein
MAMLGSHVQVEHHGNVGQVPAYLRLVGGTPEKEYRADRSSVPAGDENLAETRLLNGEAVPEEVSVLRTQGLPEPVKVAGLGDTDQDTHAHS